MGQTLGLAQARQMICLQATSLVPCFCLCMWYTCLCVHARVCPVCVMSDDFLSRCPLYFPETRSVPEPLPLRASVRLARERAPTIYPPPSRKHWD